MIYSEWPGSQVNKITAFNVKRKESLQGDLFTLDFPPPPVYPSLEQVPLPLPLTTGPRLFLLSSHSCFQAGMQVAFSFSLIIRSSGRSSILCRPFRVSLFSISRLQGKEKGEWHTYTEVISKDKQPQASFLRVSGHRIQNITANKHE